jgi:large subunit ribosomal protein L13
MKTVTIDASSQSLGRLASQVATLLRGKNQIDFAPNRLPDQMIKVVNVNKIKLSGHKSTDKVYRRHSRYLGHLKSVAYPNVGPEKAFKKALTAMLPKNRLRKRMIKKLIIVK